MNTTPTLADIHLAAEAIDGALSKTPVLDITSTFSAPLLPESAKVVMKMELFQRAGSFKARGAYLGMNALSDDERAHGVVAVSGGNHALAVAWAAQSLGISAKVVMPAHVDPTRIDGCRQSGADVILCDTIAHAFDEMDNIADTENRMIMHPFEASHMVLGAATCAVEFLKAHPDLDTFVVPVGGGGLLSGMSLAIKQIKPDAVVYGVEPFGADAMYQSFKTGTVTSLNKVDTIADSLGAPMTAPYSLGIALAHVDAIVRLSDDDMRAAMRTLLAEMKILAEPACASTFAAVTGPLREQVTGKNIGIIACGSNISLERFLTLTTT